MRFILISSPNSISAQSIIASLPLTLLYVNFTPQSTIQDLLFTANPPQRLVSTAYSYEHLTTNDWFEVEGMTTGRVFLLYYGPAVGYPDFPAYIEEANLLKEHVLNYVGLYTANSRPGL